MKSDIFTFAPSGKTLSQVIITPRQGEAFLSLPGSIFVKICFPTTE